MKVMPFIDGQALDMGRIAPHFTTYRDGMKGGYVYLYFCVPIGRVLVSVNGRDFIGVIGVTRTLDALGIIDAGGQRLVKVPAYLNRNETAVLIGNPW